MIDSLITVTGVFLVTDMDFCLDICHQTLHIAKTVQKLRKKFTTYTK